MSFDGFATEASTSALSLNQRPCAYWLHKIAQSRQVKSTWSYRNGHEFPSMHFSRTFWIAADTAALGSAASAIGIKLTEDKVKYTWLTFVSNALALNTIDDGEYESALIVPFDENAYKISGVFKDCSYKAMLDIRKALFNNGMAIFHKGFKGYNRTERSTLVLDESFYTHMNKYLTPPTTTQGLPPKDSAQEPTSPLPRVDKKPIQSHYLAVAPPQKQGVRIENATFTKDTCNMAEVHNDLHWASVVRDRETKRCVALHARNTQRLEALKPYMARLTDWCGRELPNYIWQWSHQGEDGSVSGGRLQTQDMGVGPGVRKGYHLDGKPVCEIDMKGSHVWQAYVASGCEMPADPYAAPGFAADMRPVLKQALLASLNANGDASAIKAIAVELGRQAIPEIKSYLREIGAFKALATDKYLFGLKWANQAQAFLNSGSWVKVMAHLTDTSPAAAFTLKQRCIYLRHNASEIYEAIVSAHAPIRHFIASDAGVVFMRNEGEANLLMMERCLEAGMTCPRPMHDGMLVPKEEAEAYTAIWCDAWEFLLGSKPVVTIK